MIKGLVRELSSKVRHASSLPRALLQHYAPCTCQFFSVTCSGLYVQSYQPRG